MAVVVGKNDELLFFLEESAIGELNSYDLVSRTIGIYLYI